MFIHKLEVKLSHFALGHAKDTARIIRNASELGRVKSALTLHYLLQVVVRDHASGGARYGRGCLVAATLAALRVVLVPLVRRAVRMMVLGGSRLTLHVAVNHGAHRLVQAVVLLGLMQLLSAKLTCTGCTVLLVHRHGVSEDGATLAICSPHYHDLASRGWQLGRAASNTRCVVAAR